MKASAKNAPGRAMIEAYLCSGKSRGNIIFLSLIRFVMALCGALGTVFCFTSCIDTGVSAGLIAADIIVVSLLFSAAFTLKTKYYIPSALFLSGIFMTLVYIFRQRFCNGLAAVINIYLANVNADYADKPYIDLLYPDYAEADIRVFMLLTAAFIAAVYCFGMVRGVSVTAVALVSVPPVELCLLYGLAPNYIAFFTVLASWFAAIALDMSMPDDNRAYRRASTQCGAAAALMALLCALGAFAFVRFGGYERPQKLDNVYSDVRAYFEDKTIGDVIEEIRLTEIIKKSGAVDHGKLGENDRISFNNTPVLQVTMPKSRDTVYLRGFVGSVYTGRSWEELPQSALEELESINASFETEGLNTLTFDSCNLRAANPQLTEYSFSVTNIAAGSDYLYMPYNLVPESVSRYNIQNDVFTGGEQSWFGRVYDPSSVYGYGMILSRQWAIPTASLSSDQGRYAAFVRRNYLDVPENFASADVVFDERYYDFITYEENTEGKSTLTDATVFGRKIYYIKSWLRDNCAYSLNAGKLPDGADFADYFVTENRRGSCSHFATAAVLLCRYAGIPARYVEGYVIKPSDFSEEGRYGGVETVELTDTRAHAWAEVYVSGFGWYPVEFTSGYGNVQTAVTTAPIFEEETEAAAESEQPAETSVSAGEQNAAAPNDNAIQTTITSPVQPQAAETDNAAETVTEQTAEAAPEQDPTVGFSLFGREGGAVKDVVYDLTWTLIPVGIIAAVILFIAARRLYIERTYRRSLHSGRQSAAKAIYRRFAKLVKALGLEEQGTLTYSEYAAALSGSSPVLSDGTADTVINAALKAEFGGNRLTKEDVSKMNLAVNTAVKKYLNSLNKPQRLYAKYIVGII
ncbi:MAG: transglutaminaseTgpA domain-containing protein [Oscillospiraceae bacterium]